MKNSTKILIALASLVSLGACQQKAVYTTSSFVRFASTSQTVNEDVGTVTIPVYAYQSDGTTAFPGAGAAATNTSVTFALVDGTAVSGTDYELVDPANGVLEFQGDSIQYITVRIIERPTEMTGTLNFSIQLNSATNGYAIGGVSTTSVRILDLDQTTDDLLGSYTVTAETYYYGTTTWTATFSQGSGTNERLINGLTPDMVDYDNLNGLYGTLSDDGLTFTIELPYWLNVSYSTYGYFVYTLYDGQYYYDTTETLTFTYEGGQWTSDYGIYVCLGTTNGDIDTIESGWDIIYPGIVLEAQ